MIVSHLTFTLVALHASLVSAATSSTGDFNILSYVNPFIGTTNGGHVFPGATLPHGMAKVGMDTNSPGNQAGYDANAAYSVTGFSQMHDSGTGGGIPLSNFKLFPLANCSSFEKCPTSIAGRQTPRKINADGTPDDFASPGYFSTNVSTDIRVELTATRRTALHRYTFPTSSAHPRIVVDISDDVPLSSTDVEGDVDPNTGRVTGGASFQVSFGPGYYRAYTCVDFQAEGYNLTGPSEYGIFTSDYQLRNTTSVDQVHYGSVDQIGALLAFLPADNNSVTTILARVGVSFISSAQACANAESEIPDFDFEGTRQAASDEWSELLGRVKVDQQGVEDEIVELFYSSLYRTHISPADYTGENPSWNSTEPYYDSLYCNWDTYRTLYPLMSLHDPERFADIVRGMIDIQKHEGKTDTGWLPECRGATKQQYIQGGSNGDPILGEFYVKFSDYASSLNVSPTDLYSALLADAEDQPPNWNLQGRQANVWKKYNYIPQDVYESGGMSTRQVSRTLEYAFGDFAISQVSNLMNMSSDSSKYTARAANYANVWNPNITVPGMDGVRGMMQPRLIDGTFNFTDPRHCSIHDPEHATCYLDAANHDGFYEASPLVYVPQDMAALIELQGGNDPFISRLDYLFDQNYFDVGDEPSQQIPFMYHYANRPGLSTQRSRQVIAQSFNTTVSGLPGNDDLGAMASYAAFYLAGMYPLPATQQLLLSSPYFPQISFFNPTFNSTTTILSKNFQGNPITGTGGYVFVKNVTINGQPWHSNCYIEWEAFKSGSLIELELTDDITVGCGETVDALPPSLSTGGYD
ncbi:glycoside hydrolase family 92 protein [Athelia psychrophila]|uniref:Glycoside hydrolase family 92 protein n=1 Tax=Athelia psychrophila TaxID=1759441 RepID=A0A166D8Y9_9AGAM|nr:glycoside hydrolase family 92 protein [Fibularhizoctonia sp. CBS 109695]